MKLLLLLFLGSLLLILPTKAQTKVTVLGKINHMDPSEKLYLELGGMMTPLKSLEHGQFSVTLSIPNLPSFISLNTISNRGKIERQVPLIWFDSDTLRVAIDWRNKAYEVPHVLPFQATSERIESLDKGGRNAYILQNPTTASLYFANRYKDEFSLSDLEAFLTTLEPTDRQSSLAKRIESYVRAKKLGPLSVGKKITDFQLVDAAGNLIPIPNSNRTPKLISLFSSSCQFSIASIKLLAELNKLNQGQLELVTIWTDESRDTWLNAFKDQKAQITWTNLWDEFGFAQTYLDLKAWPTFYLVNEEGVLTEKFSNSKSLGKKMKGL